LACCRKKLPERLACLAALLDTFTHVYVFTQKVFTHSHMEPYLVSGAFDLITGACVVASLQLAQSVLFPPAPRIGKLGNDLAPQGAVRRKEEACSGANVPWCYFAVSEITCATNQEIPGL
jgi:hypothetical protein